jgi:hypothetical protein
MDLATLKTKPRSERVTKIFGVDLPAYQADFLDYHKQEKKTQAAPQKGRQVGATFVASLLVADRALTTRDETTLITAPNQTPADELFREFKRHFKRADIALEQFGIEEFKATEVTFTNGHRVISRTLGQSELSQRGISPSCVVVDEAETATDYHIEEVIEPFFITHESYEFYLLGTPLGKSGPLYHAIAGKNAENWHSPHWPTEISPFADDEYLAEKRQEKDSQTFAQEYLGEFVEAADAYLPHDIVQPCIDPDAHRQQAIPRWLGVDPSERGDDELVIYDIDTNGVCHNIWSKQTVTGTDFVGLLTDLQTGETCPEPNVGTGKLPVHGYESIVVESNMAGLATDIAQAGLGSVILPVKSTKKSKGPMYKRFKRDIEAQELTFYNYRKFINQTTSLQYSYTANNHLKLSHPQGGHDDYPDAAMLANAGRVGLAQEYSTNIEGSTASKASPTFGW